MTLLSALPCSPHWRYGLYVVRHKWFVLRAGLRTGAPLWRLIVHDWSKFLPDEWRAYCTFFYGPDPTGQPRGPWDRPNVEANKKAEMEQRKAAFDRAWLRHLHRQPHHWQHHILRNDDGSTQALEMPEPLVREMVADWAGAGRAMTGRWDIWPWYTANQGKMVLHPNTRTMVERVLARTF